LEENGLDINTTDGIMDASHVEKQLIAFFTQKHCFYEKGYEEDVEITRLKNMRPGQGLHRYKIPS